MYWENFQKCGNFDKCIDNFFKKTASYGNCTTKFFKKGKIPTNKLPNTVEIVYNETGYNEQIFMLKFGLLSKYTQQISVITRSHITRNRL